MYKIFKNKDTKVKKLLDKEKFVQEKAAVMMMMMMIMMKGVSQVSMRQCSSNQHAQQCVMHLLASVR